MDNSISLRPKYQVTVGNVGTVLDTDNWTDALHTYSNYRGQSQSGVGRAAGEPVTLMRDGEPYFEYGGKPDPDGDW